MTSTAGATSSTTTTTSTTSSSPGTTTFSYFFVVRLLLLTGYAPPLFLRDTKANARQKKCVLRLSRILGAHAHYIQSCLPLCVSFECLSLRQHFVEPTDLSASFCECPLPLAPLASTE
jgi:hypothetical protein